MTYKAELQKAINLLATDNRVIFIGQGAEYDGSPMYEMVKNISPGKRIEMPVAEDMQTGIAIGLALEGFIPVSMYPRFDFIMCCMNQLVNHLDKIETMSNGQYKPKVIIRVAVGSTKPLYPGEQHRQDYSEGLKVILKNIKVVNLLEAENIVPEYKKALESDKSTILVEYTAKIRGY